MQFAETTGTEPADSNTTPPSLPPYRGSYRLPIGPLAYLRRQSLETRSVNCQNSANRITNVARLLPPKNSPA